MCDIPYNDSLSCSVYPAPFRCHRLPSSILARGFESTRRTRRSSPFYFYTSSRTSSREASPLSAFRYHLGSTLSFGIALQHPRPSSLSSPPSPTNRLIPSRPVPPRKNSLTPHDALPTLAYSSHLGAIHLGRQVHLQYRTRPRVFELGRTRRLLEACRHRYRGRG